MKEEKDRKQKRYSLRNDNKQSLIDRDLKCPRKLTDRERKVKRECLSPFVRTALIWG